MGLLTVTSCLSNSDGIVPNKHQTLDFSSERSVSNAHAQSGTTRVNPKANDENFEKRVTLDCRRERGQECSLRVGRYRGNIQRGRGF